MDIHGTLATELPKPSQLLHHYSEDSGERRILFGVTSSAQTTTRNAVVIIILSGSDNGLRTSGPCRKKACRQISIVDQETATSRSEVLSWQAFSSTFDGICWKIVFFNWKSIILALFEYYIALLDC